MTEKIDRPKIFALDRYSLFAPVEGGKRASLVFGMREGYPRITVWTGVQSDNDGKGYITAAFDLDHFLMFLNRLEKVARTDGVQKELFAVKHWPRDPQGNIKGDKETSCEVWYGKNEEGVVWISLVQKDRPKILFEIFISDFHEIITSKGKMTKPESSVVRTSVMCGVLKHWFTNNALTFRDTSIPRENKGPYSARKTTSTGYSSSAATSDSGYDDVTF